MSVELDGPVIGRVYIAPEHNMNGKSRTGMLATRAALKEAGTAPVQILEALDVIIDYPQPGTEVVRELESQGKFLYGAQGNNDEQDQPYFGLLYAEAEGQSQEFGFQAVKMGIWAATNHHYSESRIHDSLRSAVLKTEEQWSDRIRFGIPVNRATRIGGFVIEGDVGNTYGYTQDMEAIERLAVPENAKRLLVAVMQTWHAAEEHDKIGPYQTKLNALERALGLPRTQPQAAKP